MYIYLCAWHIVSIQQLFTVTTMVMLGAGHSVEEATSLTSEDL